MKLRALDQIHISAVQANSLREGQEFVIGDAFGDELLKAHPDKFEKIDDGQPESAPTSAPIALKMQTPPSNKAERKPANKAAKRGKPGKGK